MANTLSRFQPIARPQTAPGHCYLCRGIEGPFISTGVNVKFEGMLIVCKDCIQHMFEQLDLPVVKNQAEFDEHGARRFAEGAAVGQNYALESLRDFIGEFVPVDYSPAPASGSSSPDPVEDAEVISADTGETVSTDEGNSDGSVEDSEGNSGESGEDRSSTDGSSVEGIESSSLFGRFDVSSDSSDGNSDRGLAQLGL